MKISEFPSGHIETRGQIRVMKSDSYRSDAPGVWRFLLPVASRLGGDVWTYLNEADVDVMEEDEAIMSVAAVRLANLCRSDPECRLRDGRLVSDVDHRYLWTDP